MNNTGRSTLLLTPSNQPSTASSYQCDFRPEASNRSRDILDEKARQDANATVPKYSVLVQMSVESSPAPEWWDEDSPF